MLHPQHKLAHLPCLSCWLYKRYLQGSISCGFVFVPSFTKNDHSMSAFVTFAFWVQRGKNTLIVSGLEDFELRTCEY